RKLLRTQVVAEQTGSRVRPFARQAGESVTPAAVEVPVDKRPAQPALRVEVIDRVRAEKDRKPAVAMESRDDRLRVIGNLELNALLQGGRLGHQVFAIRFVP